MRKGRQHKFAISACVYALLLAPTLNMYIFISDSDTINISSCFFFITCLQTSQQSVRCLQAYKPPLPGRFPSWNCHIFSVAFLSLSLSHPPLPNNQRQTLTAYEEGDLSRTSCQYWVANPMRAQQEEKSATHL